MASQELAPITGRRKRPHVAENSRKRVAKACQSCRRVKEKCEGGFPCSRCRRLNRSCLTDAVSRPIRTSDDHQDDMQDFFNIERIKALEAAVTHYTGCVDFDTNSLRQLCNQPVTTFTSPTDRSLLSSNNEPLQANQRTDTVPAAVHPSTYDGDLSHCSFLDHLQRKIDEGLTGSFKRRPLIAVNSKNALRVSRLASGDVTVSTAVTALPPFEVARFLVDVFFGFAQTNYSYVDEASFRAKIEENYPNACSPTVRDAPWISTVLMVLAIGSQMAHLSSRHPPQVFTERGASSPNDMVVPDDDVALSFYHAASTLLSDVIVVASIESVQALLLMGVYTLPIDAAGLSYSYLGIAVRLAVQNWLHRDNSEDLLDRRQTEQRNRLWWSVYTLERRISVLHGMPVSLVGSEVDAPLPTRLSEPHFDEKIDTLPNVLAMIRLTSLLEEARDKISSLRQLSVEMRPAIVASVMDLKTELSSYWESLPDRTFCRDLTPSGLLFRVNVHLALTYHLIHIFMGRTFMFNPDSLNKNSTWCEMGESLVSACIDSAVATIDLCQLLQDEVGLARASYTEFTSCRSALLVILARRIQQHDDNLQKASERGLRLINYMAVGLYSAAAEKANIEAMESAVQRLNRRAARQVFESAENSSTAYSQFRSWATLRKNGGGSHLSSPGSATQNSHGSTGSGKDSAPGDRAQASYASYDADFNSLFSSFPFELNEFASISGFNQDLNFRFESLSGADHHPRRDQQMLLTQYD